MAPPVSVIIVVKNDPGIENTLGLIFDQKIDTDFEVIVIDASAHQRLAAIRNKYPRVTWEQYDQRGKRFTISEQRNRGLEIARGEIIVFIDANCMPAKDWLAALVSVVAGGENIVCGPCRPSNSKNFVHYIQEHAAKTYVEECTTINVAMRRQVVNAIGFFD